MDEEHPSLFTFLAGLAVPRISTLVSKLMEDYFSRSYLLKDETFSSQLTNLYRQERIFLESTAVAGLAGPSKFLNSKAGVNYLTNHQLTDKMDKATHIAWGTGGPIVPDKEKEVFILDG